MRRLTAALALALVLPLIAADPAAAAEVVVQDGETLSQIAERHRVSLPRLLEINGIRDPDLVQAGTRLTLPPAVPSGRPAATPRSAASLTVKEGETLSQIAERHGLSVAALMQLNGLSNADQLQVGQVLRLRATTAAPTTAARSGGAATSTAAAGYPRGARDHVVRPGESLSVIADGYGLSLSRLISLNGISDPNRVEAGTRLKLSGPAATAATPRPTTATMTAAGGRPAVSTATAAANPAPGPAAASRTVAAPDWRTYGPLQVNWAAWQPLGGSMVAPGLNAQGQSLYLAINCSAGKINNTSTAGAWQSWSDPAADYERQLVSDYCRRST
ncbi:MAG: LysM peptidoglycan-binding domain-containing protein [Cyanobium sp.]